MEYLEILKIFAWPLCVVVIVMVFLFIIKKEIRERISKIKSVSKTTVLMEPTQETSITNYHSNDDLLGKNDSITVKEQKERIKQDLKNRNLDHNPTEANDILIHQLAITQLKLDFERIYNTIFGSQIYLLKKLNENTKSKKDVHSYISSIINSNEALHDWSIDEYLNFLLAYSLIIFDSQKELYNITFIGQEFLLWLLQSGKNENKNL